MSRRPLQILMGFWDPGYPDIVPRVAWATGKLEQGFLKHKAQGRMVLDLCPIQICHLKILEDILAKFKSSLKRKCEQKYNVSIYLLTPLLFFSKCDKNKQDSKSTI